MGEVGVDSLWDALKTVGIRRPNQDWISEIITRDYNGVGHLNREDFGTFTSIYHDRYTKDMLAQFNSADTSRDGLISTGELSSYLRNRGISPVPGVVDDLFAEVSEHGKDPLGLTMEGFLQIEAVIKERRGFTLKETRYLADIFDRFDKDEDGQINKHEIHSALAWMGFIIDEADIEKLIKDADVEGTAGLFDEGKFLRVSREHREQEVKRYRHLFGDQDKDDSGTMEEED